MSAALERRIALLEAKDEISRVMSTYLQLVDTQAGGEEISALFTEDAIYRPGGMLSTENPVVEGRETLRKLFDQVPGILPFTVHYAMNPAIEVDLDAGTAHGKWHALEFMTGVVGNQKESIGLVADYENVFRLVDDRWLLAEVSYADRVSFPWRDGWTESRYVSMATLEVSPHE